MILSITTVHIATFHLRSRFASAVWCVTVTMIANYVIGRVTEINVVTVCFAILRGCQNLLSAAFASMRRQSEASWPQCEPHATV